MPENKTLFGVLYDLAEFQRQDARLAERIEELEQQRKDLGSKLSATHFLAKRAMRALKPGTVVKVTDSVYFQLDPETGRVTPVELTYATQIDIPDDGPEPADSFADQLLEASDADMQQAARFAIFDAAANAIEVGVTDDELAFAPAS